MIQSLVHRARHALKHRQGHGWLGRHIFLAVPTESSTYGDVEDIEQRGEGEGEDEDVKEERLMVDSGTFAFHAYHRLSLGVVSAVPSCALHSMIMMECNARICPYLESHI